ncbi:MAG TPA: alpha/beta hydrolase [Novosphingobium sp.]|nr:alpha/beta hydrolase [Novosphingobium sp.]
MDRRAIPSHARESAWIASDGYRIRRIDWADPPLGPGEAPRGSLLFAPGRGDHYEKYLETLQHWHARGWRVTAIDWRGQAGSGRFGADPLTGHIEDFAIWLDDLAAFWGEWAAAHPGPRVLAGHSMGGHLALRAVAERRVDPQALVLVAPMLGFLGRMPNALMQTAARAMAAIGDPRRPAWKWSEKPGEKLAFRARLLTHDAERYADEIWWRENRPAVAMGPGSWRWVERAYASMRAIDAPGVLEAVTTPAILLATSADGLVGWRAIERAARRLPRAQLARFDGEARHEILREADPVRDKALRLIDEFLDQVAPAEE